VPELEKDGRNEIGRSTKKGDLGVDKKKLSNPKGGILVRKCRPLVEADSRGYNKNCGVGKGEGPKNEVNVASWKQS